MGELTETPGRGDALTTVYAVRAIVCTGLLWIPVILRAEPRGLHPAK